ncbi:MAG: serpin family protein [Actinomycetota bacterium]
MRRILLLLFLVIILISGCVKALENPEEIIPTTDDSKATEEGVETVINANNQFTLDLYLKFKDEEENIFFSPYSISTALVMTYEGARGKTAEEMRSVFYFPEDDDMRRYSFARIYNQINKKDKKYKLHTANALWTQIDYSFLDEYLDVVEKYYAGKATNLDFVNETEKSRKTINSWVEEKTNNKIKNLIPAGILDAETRLVLTNAIYFKGTWLLQFNKEYTRQEDFRVSPEKTVKVDMMSLTDEEFNYAETEELQILELLYEGEDLSMLIILPKENDLNSLEDSFSLEKLSELRNSLGVQKVDIYIPKFKFETKYFMVKTLKEMGMPTAFSMDADFSGMDGATDLFIANVIHQAFVDVNEEGTEAAAATGVVMELKAAMPTVFRADHPFIFMIQERETGNILLLGRVIDPAQ